MSKAYHDEALRLHRGRVVVGGGGSTETLALGAKQTQQSRVLDSPESTLDVLRRHRVVFSGTDDVDEELAEALVRVDGPAPRLVECLEDLGDALGRLQRA